MVKDSCEGYPALLSTSQIAARNGIGRSRDLCAQFVERLLKKEQNVIFTKDSLYLDIVDALRDKLKAGDDKIKSGNHHKGHEEDVKDREHKFVLVIDCFRCRNMCIHIQTSSW